MEHYCFVGSLYVRSQRFFTYVTPTDFFRRIGSKILLRTEERDTPRNTDYKLITSESTRNDSRLVIQSRMTRGDTNLALKQMASGKDNGQSVGTRS